MSAPSISAPLAPAIRWQQRRPDRPDRISRKSILAVMLGILITLITALAPESLPDRAGLALLITGLAIIGWTLTPVPDSVVAVLAALALVVLGVFPEDRFYAALGSELTWLLIAAFVIAAVIRSSGLLERFAYRAVAPFRSVTWFFHALAFVVAMTAFLVPSTSGRAALLLPVFLSLTGAMPGPGARKALALLFPTAILLSAGGSLIGAGAHFLAVEAIRTATGTQISYFEWIATALPIALIATHAATVLIVLLFVPADERSAPIAAHDAASRSHFSTREKRIAMALLVMVAAWSTTGLHGVGIAMIACAGAALLITPPFTDEKPKNLFRNVESELLVFLAATVAIAEAMVVSGASKWLADGAMELLPAAALRSRTAVIVFVTLISVAAHLMVNSRSARAAVLIPAVALPLVEFGHDARTLILVTVLGTGFCQTLMTSAKPVAIFANSEGETFTQRDLFRLAIPLLPIKAAIIAAFALFVWPQADRQAPAAATAEGAPNVAAETQPTAAAQPLLDGALCTRDELERVMLATIGERKMWAAGWWHVWKRLTRDGYAVEKHAVRALYNDGEMVLLRAHSVRLAAIDMAGGSVAQARQACSGRQVLPEAPSAIPLPKPRPAG